MKYEIETTNIFDTWFAGVKDTKSKARIISSFDKVQLGNFGDHKNLGGNLFDLRFFFGSGYRVYYTISSGKIVYDSKSENRSQGLVEKFKKNGFVNVKNKGNWNVKFDFPFIYYRNLDDVKSSVNTQITSYLNDSFLYKEHFKKSKIKRIQQLFKQNQNLTFVIVL